MAVTKLRGGERRFELAIAAGTDPKVASAAIARFHRKQVKLARKENRGLSFIDENDIGEFTAVDGVRGAPLESVKPDGGLIVTVFPFPIAAVIEYLDYLLITRSPVNKDPAKGAPGPPYQRNHRLFADGFEVDPTNPPLDAKAYIFQNNRPYARKIEGSANRPPQGSAPAEGVYKGAVKLATQRFGTFFQIRFTFQAVIEGGVQDYSKVAASKRRDTREARRAHTALRYPAVRITRR